MIHPLKNNELTDIFSELENQATDPADVYSRKCTIIYNSVLDVCKHVDDSIANRIITFLNDLKTKHGC